MTSHSVENRSGLPSISNRMKAAVLIVAGAVWLMPPGSRDTDTASEFESRQGLHCSQQSPGLVTRAQDADGVPQSGTITAITNTTIALNAFARSFYEQPSTGVDSLSSANKNLDITEPIRKGTVVTIPISKFAIAKTTKATTFAAMAEDKNLDAGLLACLNGSEDSSAAVGEGTKLVLPRQAAVPANQLPVIAQAGDTYESIAKNFKGTIGAIPKSDIIAGDVIPVKTTADDKETASCEKIAVPNTKNGQYFHEYCAAAIRSEKAVGVPKELVLAMSAHESGYGLSKLTKQGNNFFGIKKSKDWTGEVIRMKTHEQVTAAGLNDFEYIDKRKIGPNLYDITIMAPFRAYDSPEESFKDYGVFLKTRGNAQSGMFYADAFYEKNPKKFLNKLVDNKGPRYATDRQYSKNVGKKVDAFSNLFKKDKN